jgi:hypothetical protein
VTRYAVRAGAVRDMRGRDEVARSELQGVVSKVPEKVSVMSWCGRHSRLR